MEAAIITNKLTRFYGKTCVVNQVSLQVPTGSVFGLLGRNGAGKSTFLRMVTGVAEPTRGSSSVWGVDSRALTPELRAKIGYMTEGHFVYGWMSLREIEKFQRAGFPNWNSDLFHAVVRHFELDSNQKCGALSRGQRAGLSLALTLAPEPDLLILDDPALGLDPVARRSLLESIIYLVRKAGRTILFSSHLLSDLERVADRIAILDQGQLKACCSVEEFKSRIRRVSFSSQLLKDNLESFPGLLQIVRTPQNTTLSFVDSPESSLSLEKLGMPLEEVSMGLEDAFISFVGKRGEKRFFLTELET